MLAEILGGIGFYLIMDAMLGGPVSVIALATAKRIGSGGGLPRSKNLRKNNLSLNCAKLH